MRILYPLILILLTFGSAFGQVPIKISEDKVNVDGKYYYAHPVKKQETLYSIGKAYGVTTDAIVRSNAALASGLKEGTIIYIPVQEGAVSANAGTPQQLPAEQKTQQKKYKRHTVKWYEDITGISEKYGVTVDAIIALNNLPDGKLQPRQVLQIPDNDFVAQIAATLAAVQNSNESDETLLAQSDSLAQNGEANENLSAVTMRDKSQPLEIALVLPLNSSDSANINSNFMDFYAGALLAVRDYNKLSGSKIKVNVYDVNVYTPLHTLTDEPGFADNQLIIGPARAGRIGELIGYATSAQIPLVSPLDNNAESLMEACPYLIQMPVSSEFQIENLVEQLARQYNEQNAPVLFITEKSGADAALVEKTRTLLEQKSVPFTPICYDILDGRTINEVMIQHIDTLTGTPNLAIVPSNNAAFVSDVVRNLDICHNYGNTKMIAYGMPKWRNVETIDVELFHKLNLHLSIPYYVDYNNSNAITFLQTYRALYNSEPTPYSFQGYDITKYFIALADEYGKSFIKADEMVHSQMLQCNIRLENNRNKATRDIVYNSDYTISVINQ